MEHLPATTTHNMLLLISMLIGWLGVGTCRMPNPRIQWEDCGQKRVSFVCDPEELVLPLDRDRLVDIVADAQIILKGM